MNRKIITTSFIILFSSLSFADISEKNIEKKEPVYYTDVIKGCEILGSLSDLAMNYRQLGHSKYKALQGITVDKFLEKRMFDMNDEENKEIGIKLEKYYQSIVDISYKFKVEETEELKFKALKNFTDKFSVNCLKEKIRF